MDSVEGARDQVRRNAVREDRRDDDQQDDPQCYQCAGDGQVGDAKAIG
ncbi:hypothetical protein [Nocardia sp. CC227C]|nr:hypothetical protein [Nocardia sp. CC227C]